MINLSTVNRALAQYNVQLVRGKGYFYFDGPGTERWAATAVYVNSLNQLSLEQWIDEYKYLSGEK